MIRTGDQLVDVADPRGGWSVRLARGTLDEGVGVILSGRQGTALCDENEHGNVLVDVSPDPVYGGGKGVWMRVLR